MKVNRDAHNVEFAALKKKAEADKTVIPGLGVINTKRYYEYEKVMDKTMKNLIKNGQKLLLNKFKQVIKDMQFRYKLMAQDTAKKNAWMPKAVADITSTQLQLLSERDAEKKAISNAMEDVARDSAGQEEKLAAYPWLLNRPKDCG